MPEFVPSCRYGDAITEIYELRAALAYEAAITRFTVDYATFPKGRRPVHDAQIDRMAAAARGDRAGYADPEVAKRRKHALESAGADQCLTNSQWERAQGYEDLAPTDRAVSALMEAQRAVADGDSSWYVRNRLDQVQAEVDRLRGRSPEATP